jgi:hypothetical protein
LKPRLLGSEVAGAGLTGCASRLAKHGLLLCKPWLARRLRGHVDGLLAGAQALLDRADALCKVRSRPGKLASGLTQKALRATEVCAHGTCSHALRLGQAREPLSDGGRRRLQVRLAGERSHVLGRGQ